jgi:Raf kinase inhibitor-like YbhB/YbcL family protein
MQWIMLIIMLLAVSCSVRKNAESLIVSSSAFSDNGHIPVKYTCRGEDISPPLRIEGVPKSSKDLVLIMDDPDAPGGTWVHWVMWNLSDADIAEDAAPGIQGTNSWGKTGYDGPCPPQGIHHYMFKVYALDSLLKLPTTATKSDVERAMQGHVIAEGRLTGLYNKEWS